MVGLERKKKKRVIPTKLLMSNTLSGGLNCNRYGILPDYLDPKYKTPPKDDITQAMVKYAERLKFKSIKESVKQFSQLSLIHI